MNMDFRAYAQNLELHKYPRTPHLESSRLQPGDTDSDQVRYASLNGQWLVVEEKLDGANYHSRIYSNVSNCLGSTPIAALNGWAPNNRISFSHAIRSTSSIQSAQPDQSQSTHRPHRCSWFYDFSWLRSQ